MRRCNVCNKEFDRSAPNFFGVCSDCESQQMKANAEGIAHANSPEELEKMRELREILDKALREQL